MDTESFYRHLPDVPPANIVPDPLAHGAEAVVEHVNGEVVFRFRLKVPVSSQISPLLTQAEWNKIDRDIDNASSFDLNIRNLEKPWEDVFLQVLGALVRDENEQISTKSQYLVWRFKAEADNEAIVNLERSVRGSKGLIKEFIPDIVNVLRLTLPGGHHELVAIVFAELKRAISRQHTCHWDPKTQKFCLSYQQIPNSDKAVKLLRHTLRVARKQVEAQALLQHAVYVARYGRVQPELLPILSREMVLIAAVGPWFMVARRADCAKAWTGLRADFSNRDDMAILERVGDLNEVPVASTDDDAADPEESPERLAEDLRQLKPFDFSTMKRHLLAENVGWHAVFEWDMELFNVREARGWAVLEEIKTQIHDDIALFCDDGGEMIAMRIDSV
ncbi:hypothetical protein BDZ89DRAFT_1148916 [Hymenopellis radicata]|nr:hypothetical protein BDZ89DRAFT_1148916 [Hymenopellis radicata]